MTELDRAQFPTTDWTFLASAGRAPLADLPRYQALRRRRRQAQGRAICPHERPVWRGVMVQGTRVLT